MIAAWCGKAKPARIVHLTAVRSLEKNGEASVTTAASSRSTVNAFAFGTAQNAPGVTAGLEMWHTEDGALGRDGRVDAEQRRGQAGAALELRQHQGVDRVANEGSDHRPDGLGQRERLRETIEGGHRSPANHLHISQTQQTVRAVGDGVIEIRCVQTDLQISN